MNEIFASISFIHEFAEKFIYITTYCQILNLLIIHTHAYKKKTTTIGLACNSMIESKAEKEVKAIIHRM